MESLVCRRSFHPSIVSIVVSTTFLLHIPLRVWRHRQSRVNVRSNWLGYAKLYLAPALPLISFIRLIKIWPWNGVDKLVIVSTWLSLVGSIALAWISNVDHNRSIRPSDAAAIYLLVTIVSGLIESTYPLSPSLVESTSVWLITSDILTRITLLWLESQSKASILDPDFSQLPPEEASGIFASLFFWWINSLLAQGNKKILQVPDLPTLPDALQPERLRVIILRLWSQREKPEGKATLPKVLLGCLKTPFWWVALPRLFLVIFRCSQPILIHEVIRFLSRSRAADDRVCGSFWILLSSIVVYVGVALSTSIYQHHLNRLQVMIRGTLISLIHHKTLSQGFSVSDPGQPVTLMSTDVDGVITAAGMFHEAWGHLLELTGGLIVLSRQVGWLWPVPIALIFCCSWVSRYVAQNIRTRQKDWNMATQKRMSVVGTTLGSMKSVKALGFTEKIVSFIASLRQDEIVKSNSVRWINVIYNASANALGIFTPVITVILFAVLAEGRHSSLDVAATFTTVAVLAVVTHPANMIMTIGPRAVAAYANFERIQEYLVQEPVGDNRQPPIRSRPPLDDDNFIAAKFSNVTVTSLTNLEPLLKNISFDLRRGSITICCGSVGSGKSVLTRALLGEISLSGGTVEINPSGIGFCDQRAWLPAGSVKEIICGFNERVDEQRYHDVIRACCLEDDISKFPQKHMTRIGNRGINLSGGQRQRFALARLLYSRSRIAILDDPFTVLDGATENKIVENLLSRDGWLRKTKSTVFLITNSAQHFPTADQILLLENGQIKDRGTWDDLNFRLDDMKKFMFDGSGTTNSTYDVDALLKQQKVAQIDQAEDDLYRHAGDLSLYAYYIKSAGLFNSLYVIFFAATYSFFITVPNYWIKWWVESEREQSTYYMIGYIVISLLSWSATSALMWSTLILLAPNSGGTLHQSLLKTVFGAPLSFFSTTDIGVTLSRFGQDITYVDKHLPSAFSSLCVQTFKMIMQIALLVQVQQLLAFSLPICIVVVYLVQRAYLRTSRQLRVLELDSQSAVYSNFLETSEGAVTIRAFEWQQAVETRVLHNLNYSLRPFYTLLCIQRWLNLVLNLIVSTIALAIIFIAVSWSGTTSGAKMGVALNVILVANTTLVSLVQSWTTLEVSLGAISRFKSLERYTPREDQPWENTVPDGPWPSMGEICFRDFSAGYSSDHPIITSMNLNIPAGQKQQEGETTGKSTILLALLRLVEMTGSIKIDGRDLSRIPRSIIRQQCFITIPQDLFLLPEASLRFNLDPSLVASDEILQTSLAKVGLWGHLSSSPACDPQNVLDQPLSSLQTLSVGQTQLFAMARAIIRKNSLPLIHPFKDDENDAVRMPKPILLLDEATASLDSTTEAAIHDIIEDEFVKAGHTVIIIAHRSSVIDAKRQSAKETVVLLQNSSLELVSGGEPLI